MEWVKKNIANGGVKPWILMGDFNALSRTDDRIGAPVGILK